MAADGAWAFRRRTAVVAAVAAVVGGQITDASASATTTFVSGALTFTSPRRGWTPAERSGIEATLARLPAAITSRPLLIERGDRPCLADGLPADDQVLGPGTLHARLCDDGRFEVGRRVALTLFYALDTAAGWSSRADWRRLNGWRSSMATGWRLSPENVDADAISPRRELATFATAALLDQAVGDDRVICRLVSQAVFLRARLEELTPGVAVSPAPACEAFTQWANLSQLEDVELILAAPSSAMVGSLFGHLLLHLRYRNDDGETPIDLSRAIGFLADNDVPYRDDPGYALKGIFGRYSASLHERPFLVSYREYVVLEGRDLRRWRINLSSDERRHLLERIWTLHQEGRYRYYFFARNCATLMVDLINSALPPNRAVQMPGVLAAPPSSILERFESARAADGAPQVTYVPEPILAFEHQARLSSRRRRQVAARLVRTSPSVAAAQLQAAFQQVSSSSEMSRAAGYVALASLLGRQDVGDPADVYQFLRDSAALESHLSVVANVQADEQALIVRRQHLLVAVKRLVARLSAAGLGEPVTAIAHSDPARRMAGYQRLRETLPALMTNAPELAAQARLLVLLQSEVRYDVARMKAVAGLRDDLLFVDAERPIDEQPYVMNAGFPPPVAAQEPRLLLRMPLQTRVSEPLLALQRTKQVAFAARRMQPAAEILAGTQDAPAPQAVARAYAGALPRSGIDQLAVLTSVDALVTSGAGARGGVKAGLVFAGALYDERLGDHRRFGFPSHTAMVVARSAALFTWSDGRPAVAAHETRLIGFRSLLPKLSEGAGAGKGWPVGWDLSLDLFGSDARAVTAGVAAGWGLILRLWERDDLADHVLSTLGVAYQAEFPSAAAPHSDRPQSLGLPVGLEFRRRLGAPDSHRSHLAMRLFARPTWIALGAPVSAAVYAGGVVETHLALRRAPVGGAHDPALLVAAQVAYSSYSLTGLGPTTEATLRVGIALR